LVGTIRHVVSSPALRRLFIDIGHLESGAAAMSLAEITF
jgi:hypothetical protein